MVALNKPETICINFCNENAVAGNFPFRPNPLSEIKNPTVTVRVAVFKENTEIKIIFFKNKVEGQNSEIFSNLVLPWV